MDFPPARTPDSFAELRRPIRIAYLNENWKGGAARCVDDLARHSPAGWEARVFPQAGITGEREVMGALTAFQPDLVHLHSFYGWLPYSRLRWFASRYPTVFTPHDPRPIAQMDPACYTCTRNTTCHRCPLVPASARWMVWRHPYLRQRLKRRFVHLTTPRSLQIVAVCNWMAGRLRQQETSRFPITTIHNGVDTVRFQRRAGAREALGIPQEQQVVLFVSSRGPTWQLNPNKGLVDLAAVFSEGLAARFPQARLAVAGEWLAPNHPQVLPLGRLDEAQLALWYSAADIYVLPTRGDNFPYTVLEAMACECPVIASNVGGVSEQVIPGETGYLFPLGDRLQLARSLESLLGDPSRCRQFGARARARVEAHFSLPRFASLHAELYRSVLAARQAGAPATTHG
jgi:glycosyltransferase involved in cell wall biosynthesis